MISIEVVLRRAVAAADAACVVADLPFLHREGRHHRFQRRQVPGKLHSRTRQDFAATNFRQLRHHQRMLAEAIKRARNIALLPYTTD
jgi:hypothetical protein